MNVPRAITRLLYVGVLAMLTVAFADGDYTFVGAPYSVTETDTNQVFNVRIRRTGSAAGDNEEVRVRVSPGAAAAGNVVGTDTNNESVIVASGNGEFNVPFTIVGDNVIEPTRTLTFDIVNINSLTAAPDGNDAAGTVQLTLTDDEVATYSFTQANYVQAEGDGATDPVVDFTINRTGVTGGDERVFVQIGAAGDSASNGIDYTGGGLLEITFNAPTETRSITIDSDELLEPDETISLSFVAFEFNGQTGATPTSSITIANDDQLIGFTDANYGVLEGNAGSTTNVVTLERAGDLSVVQTVRVEVATPAGDATEGTDYANDPFTTTFGTGVATASLNIGLVGDNLAEGDEDIQLEITAIDGAVGSPYIDTANDTATLVIEDDDTPVYRFASATYSEVEGAAATTTDITVRVERSGATGDGTVTVSTVGGSAVRGAALDYVLDAGGDADTTISGGTVTLDFTGAETFEEFIVQINGDADFETDDTIIFEIAGATGDTGASIGLPDTTTVTILNDETRYSFASTAFSANEGDLTNFTNVVTLEREGDVSAAATITVNDTGGSATDGTDYATFAANNVTFNAGETTARLPIQILGDDASEPDETITLEIDPASGGGIDVTTPNTAVLTIVDDDVPVYEFTQASYDVLEGDVTNTTNVVQLTRDDALEDAETVNVNITGGSANLGTDITDPGGATIAVTFAAGQATRPVPIEILGDTTFEPDETVNLAIASFSNNGQVGAQNTTTLNINNDDDVAIYEFTQATYEVLEGDATNTTNVVQLTRTGATNVAEDVVVNVTNGTGIVGSDVTAGPITVNFGVGDVTVDVPVEILGDEGFEPDETINLAIGSTSGSGQAGTQDDAVLTLTNDDQQYRFTEATYSVVEGAGAVMMVTVEREGPPINETVSINVTGGTATAGAGNDYDGSLEAIFSDTGPDTVAIDLVVLEDAIAEGDETINLEIDDTGIDVGTPATAVVTIADNDSEYQFTAATFSQPEGNNTDDATVVTIERTGGVNTAATIEVTAANSATAPSATAGDDFTAGAVNVNFAAGEAVATVPVEILGDTAIEPDENIDLTINAATLPAGSTVGTQNTARLTLVNDDGVASFSFTSATYEVTETNTNNVATNLVTLTRTDPTPAADVTVNYVPPTTPPSPSASTAVEGDDFLVQDALVPNPVTCTPIAGTGDVEFPCTVRFAAGETTAVLPITIIGDTDTEVSERIVLTFNNGDINPVAPATVSPGVATTPNTTTLTITDNDGASGANLEVLNGISPTSPLILNGTNTTINFPVTSLGVPVDREFTLRNAGDSNLNVFSINLPAGFSLIGGFPSVLAGNSSETITIRYNAATTGISGGDVEIASSDFADSPYVFPIRGSLETAEVEVFFEGQSLVDGNATVDFGSTTVGTPATATLTINNTSNVTLLLSNLQLPAGYSIVGDFPDNVPANGSEDVTIQLDAAAAGTFAGTLSFDSNDDDESTFSLTLTGNVTEQPEPEIRVSGPLGAIESGGSYDFGVSALGESPAATFTVTNGGTADLTLDRASLTASLAGTAFSISSTFTETTLAPSASTTFEVSLDASSAGTFDTTLSFTNNDGDESPFGIALLGEVSAPEIEVRQDTRVLQDGSSVPVDFGATTLNEPVTVSFTVNNLGSVPLSLGGLDLPAGFAVDGDFPASVEGDGSATFSLVLEATSLGSFDGQVSFETNDADENPFTFRVQGVVDAAELTVLDGLLTVPNGSTVDFGSTTEGNPVNKIFTVRNEGGATLQIDNLSPLPAGFELLSPEPFTFELAPNQQATFTVSLSAETVGDFSGALQFITNDTTSSPFSVTLEGRVTAEPAPEISVSSESGAIASGSGFTFEDLPVGEDATETFTIRNTGTAPLTLGSVTVTGDNFTLAGDIGTTSLEAGASTTFEVRFDADDEGDALGTVSIDNGDEDENPYVFDLDGTAFVPSPEIAVRSGNDAVSDGGSIELGTVVTNADASITFTVTNEGEADLTLADLDVSGDGFVISNGFGDTTLEPDESTTFAVRFTAGDDAGEVSGEVTFTNNDSDENPYNITLTADVEVPQPEIAVVRGGALIADDGNLDFGEVPVGESLTVNLTVQNSGTATLTLEPVEITGEGFSLVNPFASTTLEPEASTTFTLRFNSADLVAGDYTGTISFANNDSDEDPYNFALTANVFVPVPEITVIGPSGETLEDGSSVTLPGVGVGQSAVAVFTVRNEGDASLTLNAASLASSLAGTPFSVQSPFGQTTLAPGADTQFTLSLNTSSAGALSANLAFNNNDRDENPFNLSLVATVSAGAEVDVRDGNVTIPDGSVTAVNIGETVVGTPIQRTLSVVNAGGATLTLGNFQIDSNAFTLVGTPPASLAPGQSGSLVIQLNAVSAGTPVAQVSFTSNDSNESPYTFTVRGTVTTSGGGGGGGGNGEQVIIRAGNNPPPTTITANPGDSNVAVLQALLSLEGDIAARMTRFEVRVFELLNGNRTQVTGIQDFTGLAAAKLYQDSNNNGQVDVSDALLATTTTFDANGNLVFDLNNPLPINNTSVTNVLVAYDFLADFSTNRLPVVALASLLPLALLALKRMRRLSLLMLLVIFMVACGGDGDDGGVTPPLPVGVQYQAFLVDAEAESNGQALDVTFATGDIPGSIVSLQE